MNIHYHDGCFGGTYTIDGKNIAELTDEEAKNIWLRLCNYLRTHVDAEKVVWLTEFVLDNFGTEEYDEEPCPQCGNWDVVKDLVI